MKNFVDEIEKAARQTFIQYSNCALTRDTLLKIRQDIECKLQNVVNDAKLCWRIENSSLIIEENYTSVGLQIKDGDKLIFKIDLKHKKGSDHIEVAISPYKKSYSLGINFM